MDKDLFLDKKPWRSQAYEEICSVSKEKITYGDIAKLVGVSSRNIAWLRRRLYEIIGHKDSHKHGLDRIMCKGDTEGLRDSKKNKRI